MTGKEWADAILRLVELLVSWPVILLVIVLLIRQHLPTLLAELAERVTKAPGGFEFAIRTLESRVDAATSEVQEVRGQLSELNDLVSKQFLTAMRPEMYSNLKKFAVGDFGPFEWNTGLERELYFLRDLGYVEVRSVQAIKQMGRGDNLSDLVKITEIGRKFVELRESIV